MIFNKLNLQFFAADGGGDGGSSNAGDNQTSNQNGDQSCADSSNTDNQTIPYSRFKEVNDNYKSVKDQLDQLMKEKQQADEDAKKKQGEFETLYNDLKSKHDPLAEQFKQYQETFKEVLKNKLESVPEKFKSLVPQGNEVSQLKWLENAEKSGLFKVNNVQSFGNEGNNPDNSTKKPKNLSEALAQRFKLK